MIDNKGATGSNTFTAKARVSPLPVKSPGKQSSTATVSHAFNLGSFTDPNPATSWTETISWGDSTTSTLTLPPGSLGMLNHTYATKGTKIVTVSVTDNLGGTGSNSFAVNVNAKYNGINSSPAVSSGAVIDVSGTGTLAASAASTNGTSTATVSTNSPGYTSATTSTVTASAPSQGAVTQSDVFDLALSQVSVKQKNQLVV